MRVRQLFEVLERDYVLNGRRYLKNARYAWKKMLVRWGEKAAAEITAAELELYKVDRIEHGAAPATINIELSLLRRAFRLAQQQDLIEKVPPFVLLRVDNVREGFVNPDEFQALIRTLEVLDRPVSEALRVCYHLGWRTGEVTGLRWAEVDLDGGFLLLPARRSKTRRTKRIPLNEELRILLESRWAERDGEYVFHRQGRRIRWFYGVWKRAAKALGRPDLLPHDLRRSFARNCIQSGVDRKTARTIGGWQTDSVFDRYQIVVEDDLRRAVERCYKWANSSRRFRQQDSG